MLGNLRFRIALTSVLLVKLAVGPALLSAQQVSGDVPTITIRANTRLVVVDVVVTDKKGQPVTGLKPEDFTVEENGKKQKVSVFVPPGVVSHAAPTATPGILSNHPENVVAGGIPMVLLLDAANSSFSSQAYARSQMLKYVVDHGQGRPIAVLTLTDRVRVLQQFTSDPQLLVTAIKNFMPQEPILQPGTSPSPYLSSGGLGGTSGQSLGSNLAGAIQDFANLQIGYNLERRTLITLDAMRTLSWLLGGLPGRKNVVWLTANLPFDLIPADRNVSDAELLAELPGQGKQRLVGVNAAGSLAAEQRNLHNRQISEAEAQLASAGIAIYPVDLRGLVSGMESSAAHGGGVYADPTAVSNRAISQGDSLVASHGTMEEVASQTGGKAYINENEIREGVALAASDENASYSLGYYPENKKWDGKMRNLKVKVARADSELRYRKGYFAIEPGMSKDHNYEPEVVAALAVGAPSTQISFKAQSKPTDPGKIRVVFLVDAHTLTAEDSGGSKKMNVNFYATVWGAGDKSLEAQSIKVDRTFDAATYQQILDHGMMVPVDLTIPAGGTELRLAVLDNQTGFIGTVSGPLGP
ncbi:MAG: VWA domain-containing protein [Terriglobales bacterium]|jgi:VWFA-related protein